MNFDLKQFIKSLPKFNQFEWLTRFDDAGLSIHKNKDCIIIRYIKADNTEYRAFVFRPDQYDSEIKKAIQEIYKKLDLSLIKVNKILK